MNREGVAEFIIGALTELKEGMTRLEAVMRGELRDQKSEQQALWERQWKKNDELTDGIAKLKEARAEAKGSLLTVKFIIFSGGALILGFVTLAIRVFWGH